jgi:hypothetical protein
MSIHGTWKGTDKPAGVDLLPVRTYASLPDCPFCKFGTPDEQKDGSVICADCKCVIRKPKPKEKK